MKKINCQFIGSFYNYDQLPHDNRPQIAFAGRSNVGKSSLLNRLTGQKKLAKVSQTPGKTRSINFFLVNDRFYFVDLPGYGYAKVSKKERISWGKLIENYLEKSKNIYSLILLLDCRRDVTEHDEDLIAWLQDRKISVIIVVTKADKLNKDKVNRKIHQIKENYGLTTIPFSVISGVGKKEIWNAIFDLVSDKN